MDTGDLLVQEYLTRLESAGRHLPEPLLSDLVAEVAEHIAAARAEQPGGGEVQVRNILDRLGSPEQIVEAAGVAHPDDARAESIGWQQYLAVALLLVGGIIVPFIGWFAGVALLWTSRRWTVADKVVGTLLLPGGLLIPVIFGVTNAASESGCSQDHAPDGTVLPHCTPHHSGGILSAAGITFLALLVIPLATAVYLLYRAKQHQDSVLAEEFIGDQAAGWSA